MSYKSVILYSRLGNIPTWMRDGKPRRVPNVYTRDVKFLRSWLVYDSGLDSDNRMGSFNWNFLLGMMVAGGLSAGFWAGLGVAIAGALR